MLNIIKKYSLVIIFIALIFNTINVIQPVFAGVADEAKSTLETGFKDYFDSGSSSKPRTIGMVIADVIYFILGFLGVIFIILLIYAGFIWMTARGDSEQVNKAKETLQSAIIGLIIIISSYTLTYFIIKNLTKAAGTYY